MEPLSYFPVNKIKIDKTVLNLLIYANVSGPGYSKVDNTIHWINCYPVDNIIHPLNNWALDHSKPQIKQG